MATDRTVIAAIPPIEVKREANRLAEKLGNTVFGREIFSNKNFSFEPDLNVPPPKDYVLSAGDKLVVNAN